MAIPLGGVKGLHRVTMPPDPADKALALAEAMLHRFCTTCGTRLQREIYEVKYNPQTGEELTVYESKCPQYEQDASGPGDRYTRGYQHDVVRV